MAEPQTVALVTGANRGIGREIVRRLAAQGITTVLAAPGPTRGMGRELARRPAPKGTPPVLPARDVARAEASAAEFARRGLPVVGRQLDVTDQASVDRLARSVADEFGRLDVLVNNA